MKRELATWYVHDRSNCVHDYTGSLLLHGYNRDGYCIVEEYCGAVHVVHPECLGARIDYPTTAPRAF